MKTLSKFTMSQSQNLPKPYCYLLSIGFLFSSVLSQPGPYIITTDPAYYYNLCAPSTCSNFSSLSYPFTLSPPCHFFPMQPLCPNNNTYLLHTLRSPDMSRVLSINFTDPSDISLLVAANALFTCGAQISTANYRYYDDGFKLPLSYTIGTHFNCTAPIPPTLIPDLQNASCIGCKGQDPNNICYYAPGIINAPNCEIFYVYNPYRHFNASVLQGDFRATLQRGYQITYPVPTYCLGCQASGGRCGAKPSSVFPTESGEEAFVCFCESTVHAMNCSDGMVEDLSKWVDNPHRGKSRRSTVALAVNTISSSVLIIGVIIALLSFSLRWRRRIYFNDKIFSSISTTRYSCSQLKTFTNNFGTKLGEGGFGSVYKGEIQQSDSKVPVAVKVLKISRHTKKQFISEIATVGSIHHENLVCMLGYCVEGETYALVYEFMENGSLDKHIYKGLNFKQVYSVALETARGISYLHYGCSKKILHCDIKPANVLLDSNFSARVADFGLSKMIDKDHSHFSLTVAQGTLGYAAPEIWLKTIGPVTEKSDVYSYGMLILEMVARRKNYDPEVIFSSQVYFPEWLYDNIEVIGSPLLMGKHVGDRSFESPWDEEICDEEKKILMKRICLVGLWCIQYVPSNRPTMKDVVQMLEGNIEIRIPPRPFPQQSFNNHGSTSENGIV